MAQQEVTGDIVRAALDRTSAGQHGGSISLVLAIATVLVGATVGLVLIGRGHAEPYVLGFLALMAMIGVSCCLRSPPAFCASAARTANPLLKSVVDGASEACWSRITPAG
jgi:two-component system cell cycle sensor histidine kinase/response regulator CckA